MFHRNRRRYRPRAENMMSARVPRDLPLDGFPLGHRRLRNAGQRIELAHDPDDRMPAAIAGHKRRRNPRHARFNLEAFLGQLRL